ncbi:MAG: HdeD family acid-resistance protein [Alphaproteobacteria bacterium]
MIGKFDKSNSAWILFVSLVMIGLGVYVWFHPVGAMMALALYLGIAFIFVGVGYLAAYGYWKNSRDLALGIMDVIVGLVFVSNLGITASTIPVLFAFWALFVGVTQVVAAFELKEVKAPEWKFLLVAGLISIVFGFIIVYMPIVGAITITILMGTYLIIYGLIGLVEYKVVRNMK